LVPQATDALVNIFEDDDLQKRLSPFIVEVLERLANQIPTIQSHQFFDIIFNILRVYAPTIAQNNSLLINLLTLLVNRCVEEYETRKDRQKSKLIVNKIWNSIRIVADKKEFIPAFLPDIEKALVPLFSYLEKDIDIPFDEDILLFVSTVMEKTKTVTPIMWDVFKCIPKLFTRYGGMLGPLFQALNYFIVYGMNEINSDPSAIKLLIQMGVDGLNPQHENANEASLAEAALLFHLIIQVKFFDIRSLILLVFGPTF